MMPFYGERILSKAIEQQSFGKQPESMPDIRSLGEIKGFNFDTTYMPDWARDVVSQPQCDDTVEGAPEKEA